MEKRLYRLQGDRKISGVCSGLAAYFNIDATIVRLIWLCLTLSTFGFPGVLLYLACVLVIPEDPTTHGGNTYYDD